MNHFTRVRARNEAENQETYVLSAKASQRLLGVGDDMSATQVNDALVDWVYDSPLLRNLSNTRVEIRTKDELCYVQFTLATDKGQLTCDI